MTTRKIRYITTFGILSLFVTFMLLASRIRSNADSLDMEKRFASVATDEKLSPDETKGLYSIDGSHSYVGFRVTHMGLVEVPGNFKDFRGTIDFNPMSVKNSAVEFFAYVKSIDTRINGRDNHLKSKDFFELENYPEISFKSTRLKKKGKGYRVYGNLTIKGVTKEVMIPFRIYGPIKDQGGIVRMGIRGETTINRRDFNVNYGNNLPSGIPVISDSVVIQIQLETVKKENGIAKKDG